MPQTFPHGIGKCALTNRTDQRTVSAGFKNVSHNLLIIGFSIDYMTTMTSEYPDVTS